MNCMFLHPHLFCLRGLPISTAVPFLFQWVISWPAPAESEHVGIKIAGSGMTNPGDSRPGINTRTVLNRTGKVKKGGTGFPLRRHPDLQAGNHRPA